MHLDRYQPCPCGSGKKIKFCCSAEIVDDLSRVMKMSDGDQRMAALESLDKLLSKHPNRPSLYALKCEIQLQLGQVDEARATASRFKELAPDSSVAWAHTAIVQAAGKQVQDAVTSLQRAMELTDDELPMPVYDAIGTVADVLLASGRIHAARGHYLMQVAVAGDDDPQPREILVRLNQSQQLPLLLKEDQVLATCPEGKPFGEQFQESMEMYERGAWLAARDRLKEIDAKTPDEPAVVKNIAVLEGLLGNIPAMVAAYHRYAGLDEIELNDAVGAEALAQLLDPQSDRHKIDVLKVTYAVPDAEKLLKKLVPDRSVARMPLDTNKMRNANQPPPKAGFFVLDRPLAQTGVDLQREAVSLVIGEVLLFGKETDRDARLELVLSRSDSFEEKLNTFLTVAGDTLGPVKHEQVVSQVSAAAEALAIHWHLPEDTPRECRERLMSEEIRDVILKRWPNQPIDVLDDKTPSEASKDSGYRARLLAAILLLEITSERQHWESVDFNELRSQLGLPTVDPIDPKTVDVESMPLVGLPYLVAEEMDDGSLIIAYGRAVLKRVGKAVITLGSELVQRDSLGEDVHKAGVYGVMAQHAHDPKEARQLLGKAKDAARQKGQSPAIFLISELDICLRHGPPEEAQRLLDTIRGRHVKEPGVHESLIRVLARHGLVRPDGLPAAARPAEPAPPIDSVSAPAEEARVWTPDSETPATSDAGDSEKSKIWLPGMD